MISDLLFCLVVGLGLLCFITTILEQLVDWLRSTKDKNKDS